MIKPNKSKQSRLWPFFNLTQGRVILRLFLLSTTLVILLGFAGVLQNSLGAIGAGQTELAFSIANLRNNASLKPIARMPRYSYSTTPDADLQKYFALDGDTGELTLRDGLRSIAVLTNPLQSFPYQIIEAVPGQPEPNVTSLWIQIVNCQQFLALNTTNGDSVTPANSNLSQGDAILRCIDTDPVLAQASSLAKVRKWIQEEKSNLLDTQRHEYLRNADDILNFPKLPPNTKYVWGPASAPIAHKEADPKKLDPKRVDPKQRVPVWRLFILQDKAEPGLEIFAVAHPPPAVADTLQRGGRPRTLPPESLAAQLLRSLDKLFLLILQLRYPILIGLGILAPLLAWMIHLRDKVVRRCLEPYLLLLLAQMLSLFLADALMGEGLVVWVGLIYTLLRLMQLRELFWMSRSADPRIHRLFNLRARPWLRDLLRLQVLLWGINALGLGWHIIGVFRAFPLISPA